MFTVNVIVVGSPIHPALTMARAAAIPSSKRSCWLTAIFNPARGGQVDELPSGGDVGSEGLLAEHVSAALQDRPRDAGLRPGCDGDVHHRDPLVGEQLPQGAVHRRDAVPGGHLTGPFPVEVVQAGHLQTGGAVGGQVGDVDDGARPDDRDREPVSRGDGQVGGGRDRGEQVQHGQTPIP
ncbi:hypothetical protein GCM10018952_20300 [Streptosporangium vulgare]